MTRKEMSIRAYLKASYPGRKPKPLFKLGQKVSFRRQWMRNLKDAKGRGVITRVFAAYGNVPTNYEVTGFRAGVLFEDELRLVKGLR